MKNIYKISLAILALSLLAVACGKQTQLTSPPDNAPANQVLQTGGSISYKGEQGKTALELLRASHRVETKTFKGVGEFVQSIDGVTPDSKHFWSFYVNGQPATVGADQYKTQDSDTLSWKLEAIK